MSSLSPILEEFPLAEKRKIRQGPFGALLGQGPAPEVHLSLLKPSSEWQGATLRVVTPEDEERDRRQNKIKEYGLWDAIKNTQEKDARPNPLSIPFIIPKALSRLDNAGKALLAGDKTWAGYDPDSPEFGKSRLHKTRLGRAYDALLGKEQVEGDEVFKNNRVLNKLSGYNYWGPRDRFSDLISDTAASPSTYALPAIAKLAGRGAKVTEVLPKDPLEAVWPHFREFEGMKVGARIPDPEKIIPLSHFPPHIASDLKLATPEVGIPRWRIKHVVEGRGKDAERVLRNMPEILVSPDKIVDSTAKRANSFGFAKDMKLGGRYQIIVEKRPDINKVITGYPLDKNRYEKLVDISGRTPAPEGSSFINPALIGKDPQLQRSGLMFPWAPFSVVRDNVYELKKRLLDPLLSVKPHEPPISIQPSEKADKLQKQARVKSLSTLRAEAATGSSAGNDAGLRAQVARQAIEERIEKYAKEKSISLKQARQRLGL